MDMDYFTARAAELRTFLDSLFAAQTEEFAFLQPWGSDIPRRLSSFVRSGKMIRGGLVFLGQEAAGTRPGREALHVGAAMELAQSAFLIHDDIMDRDRLRRGMSSVFWQYKEEAASRSLEDAYHYGESMGLCAGDCAFFLAFRLLSSAKLPPELLEYCAREFYAVCLAQMRDVDYGAFSDIPSEDDIEALYTWKTGRYSFSLPLVAGAMLGNANKKLLTSLETLGEILGLAFQMRDDELGLFGSEASLGKPIGSDLREGKKTLIIALAYRMLDDHSRSRIRAILGNPRADVSEIEDLRVLIEKSGARAELAVRMKELEDRSKRIIENLDTDPSVKRILMELLTFIRARNS
jgi:geranylgeranyl diphosphate synthase type I